MMGYDKDRTPGKPTAAPVAAPATPSPAPAMSSVNPAGKTLPTQASDRSREAMAAIAARRAARTAPAPTAPVAAPSTPTGPSILSQAADRARQAVAAAMHNRQMKPMGPGSSIMENGRAYAKGGMVGCGWKPKSGKTMRGAARKGK